MFDFPIEIREVESPWGNQFSMEDILPVIQKFYGQIHSMKANIKFYEVTRPGFGLVRSVITISPIFTNVPVKKSYVYTIRIFLRPDRTENIVFNLAEHHKTRIELLFTALGEKHYPPPIFLQTPNLLIVLQPFLFLPVCDFSRKTDIINLIELLYLATKARILLDYNHNHFLRSEINNVYYVDTDFMGNLCPDENHALIANLNQSMIFISSKNIPFITKALKDFSKKDFKRSEFAKRLVQQMNTYIMNSKEESMDLLPKLKEKLEALENQLINFDL
ncbi:MAG: hypothetical protein ACXAB2_09475 [Candidatus Hodarchaeales archaeon]|jgi:hypothetical protein